MWFSVFLWVCISHSPISKSLVLPLPPPHSPPPRIFPVLLFLLCYSVLFSLRVCYLLSLISLFLPTPLLLPLTPLHINYIQFLFIYLLFFCIFLLLQSFYVYLYHYLTLLFISPYTSSPSSSLPSPQCILSFFLFSALFSVILSLRVCIYHTLPSLTLPYSSPTPPLTPQKNTPGPTSKKPLRLGPGVRSGRESALGATLRVGWLGGLMRRRLAYEGDPGWASPLHYVSAALCITCSLGEGVSARQDQALYTLNS